MPYSYDLFTGDGTTDSFVATFPFNTQEELVVYLDSVLLTSGYSVNVGTKTVTLDTPPANGVEVKLKRAATVSMPLFSTNFSGSIKSTSLNTLSNQSLRINQDIHDDLVVINDGLGQTLLKSKNLADINSASESRLNLSLGSMSIQESNQVNITGLSISGCTITGECSGNMVGRNNLSEITDELTARSNLGIPENSIALQDELDAFNVFLQNMGIILPSEWLKISFGARTAWHPYGNIFNWSSADMTQSSNWWTNILQVAPTGNEKYQFFARTNCKFKVIFCPRVIESSYGFTIFSRVQGGGEDIGRVDYRACLLEGTTVRGTSINLWPNHYYQRAIAMKQNQNITFGIAGAYTPGSLIYTDNQGFLLILPDV